MEDRIKIRPGSSSARRRQLRHPGTDAEILLWQRLRSRQLVGWKFRRQHSIGPYILDFYCAQARLAVELDGGQHLEEAHRHYDEQRTQYLATRGVRVIRFSDRDVLTETASVLEAIMVALT